MEQYVKEKPLIMRLGSGKEDVNQRLLMVIEPDVFGKGEDFLGMSVCEGIERAVLNLNEAESQRVILNGDGEGVSKAPLQAVRDTLFRDGQVKKDVYIASSKVPRVNLNDKLGNYVTYTQEEGQAYNLLDFVINTEKDTQGSYF